MSKRSFPFNNCSPLQLKTHVENKHVNSNEESMQKIYGNHFLLHVFVYGLFVSNYTFTSMLEINLQVNK